MVHAVSGLSSASESGSRQKNIPGSPPSFAGNANRWAAWAFSLAPFSKVGSPAGLFRPPALSHQGACPNPLKPANTQRNSALCQPAPARLKVVAFERRSRLSISPAVSEGAGVWPASIPGASFSTSAWHMAQISVFCQLFPARRCAILF
jgi:hypothetical protein